MKAVSFFIWSFLLVVSTAAKAETASIAIFSDFDGKPAKLESYTGNGRWLVVMIWASDCHICNAEAVSYEQFHRAEHNANVRVLGISMDGEDKKSAARKFIERHKLSFPNLIGEAGMVALFYASLTKESLRGTPTFLVFDPDGELAAAQAGAVPVDSVERFIEKEQALR